MLSVAVKSKVAKNLPRWRSERNTDEAEYRRAF